jgi:hypothetical protein
MIDGQPLGEGPVDFELFETGHVMQKRGDRGEHTTTGVKLQACAQQFHFFADAPRMLVLEPYRIFELDVAGMIGGRVAVKPYREVGEQIGRI